MNSLLDVYNKLCSISKNYTDLKVIEKKADKAEWKNFIYNTEKIRYGHLEYFKANNNKVEVVHSTCYPQVNVAFPIFGFDVIALNGKITGIFCDISKCPYDNLYLRSILKNYFNMYKDKMRSLPEWAEFFSPEFLAITPDSDWNNPIVCCLNVYEKYLYAIKKDNSKLSKRDQENHKKQQNNYSLFQQQNTRTLNALAAYTGKEEAKKFMETVLFPTI